MEPRVYLRALEPNDYKTSIKWRKDDSVWNMLGGAKYFVSEAYEKKWVEDVIFNSRDLRLAICLVENDRYIGNVYMTDIDMINRSCQTHVIVGEKDCWGIGLAKEALLQCIDFMVKERGLQRFEAHILEDNKQSIKMHEKCGYKMEGLRRRSIYKNGKYHNQFIYAYLANANEL